QTVTITANDGDGGITTVTFALVVNNVAPTATIGNTGPINEGGTATVSLSSPFDPSSVDSTSLHYFFSDDAAARNASTYGGSGTAASQNFTFGDDGSFIVYARIIDKDGGFTDYQTTVVVSNVATLLTVDAASVTVNEGQTAANSGSYSDVAADTVSLSA